MGNSIRRALSDPHLVRTIQEHLGIKQVLSSSRHGAVDDGTQNDVALNSKTGLKWLARKSRRRLRPPDQPNSNPSSSEESEKPEIIVETYPVLNIFFRLASELGYEPFYITFLPFLIWNVDTTMGRHVVMMWCCSMYVGQACKALFKRKRPASPPAIRIESNPRLETEYGFPSTHATVATTIPFYILYFLYHRYDVRQRVTSHALWCQ